MTASKSGQQLRSDQPVFKHVNSVLALGNKKDSNKHIILGPSRQQKQATNHVVTKPLCPRNGACSKPRTHPAFEATGGCKGQPFLGQRMNVQLS